MANRWGNNGNRDFIFLGSKITVDGDCNHEIKRLLLLGRKTMTNLDRNLKSRYYFAYQKKKKKNNKKKNKNNRDITLPTKVRIVKAMVFPVVMYQCESWTMKKAEC